MSEAHENTQTAGNGSAIVILTLSIVILLATVPTVFLLVWLKVVNPEYFRRNVCEEANLPTAEPPADMRTDQKSLFRRAQAVVSKLRGVAVGAEGAIALRSREVFEKVRGRASRLFDGHSRRSSDLPIMRQKSWQILAESHTELTLTSSKDVEVEHNDDEVKHKDDEVEHKGDEVEHNVVGNPKKSTKTVRFDVGDEVEGLVQKPQPAVIADKKT